jgi:hypothetical protein
MIITAARFIAENLKLLMNHIVYLTAIFPETWFWIFRTFHFRKIALLRHSTALFVFMIGNNFNDLAKIQD